MVGDRIMYSKKVMDLFQHPKNMGEMKNPDGIGEIGNLTCGDVMKIYIKVEKNKRKEEVIKDIRVETFGCVAAVSSSSILTEMVKSRTIKYALSITKDQIIKKLGGLPPIKYHCSVLAVDALRNSIKDYRKKLEGNKISQRSGKKILRKHDR